MKKFHLDPPRTLSKSPRNLERNSTPHTTKASACTTINIPSQLLTIKSHKSTQKLSKFQAPPITDFSMKGNPNSLHKRTASRGKSFDIKLGNINMPSEGNNPILNHPRDRDSKSQQHKERYSEPYGQSNYLADIKPKQNTPLQDLFHRRKASLSTISHTLHAKQLVDHLENINPNKGRPKPTLITHVNLASKPLKEIEIEESKESSLNGSLLAGPSIMEYHSKSSRTLQEINYHSHQSNSVGYPMELKVQKRSSQTESLSEQLKMQEKKANVPNLGNISHGGSFQLGTSHASLDNHSIKSKERNSMKASVNSQQTSCKNHVHKKVKFIYVMEY